MCVSMCVCMRVHLHAYMCMCVLTCVCVVYGGAAVCINGFTLQAHHCGQGKILPLTRQSTGQGRPSLFSLGHLLCWLAGPCLWWWWWWGGGVRVEGRVSFGPRGSLTKATVTTKPCFHVLQTYKRGKSVSVQSYYYNLVLGLCVCV